VTLRAVHSVTFRDGLIDDLDRFYASGNRDLRVVVDV